MTEFAELATGIIRSIDIDNATITLDNDVEYALSEDIDQNQFDIAQHVEIEFENDEDGNFITNLVAVKWPKQHVEKSKHIYFIYLNSLWAVLKNRLVTNGEIRGCS